MLRGAQPSAIDLDDWKPARQMERLASPVCCKKDFAALLRLRVGVAEIAANNVNFRDHSKAFDVTKEDVTEQHHADLLKKLKAARKQPARDYALHKPPVRRASETTTMHPYSSSSPRISDRSGFASPIRRGFGTTYLAQRPQTPDDLFWPTVLPPVLPSLVETWKPWTPLQQLADDERAGLRLGLAADVHVELE